MDKNQKKTPRNRFEEYAMFMQDLEERQRESKLPLDRTVETNIMLNEVNKTLAMLFDLAAMVYNQNLAPRNGEKQ